MNAEPTNDSSIGFERLEEALIARFRLNSEQVKSTRQLKRSQNMSFVDAALHLGVISEDEALQALKWAAALVSDAEAGVIETALQRGRRSRDVIVKTRGDTVRPSPQLIIAHDQHNARSEGLRALRTELMLLINNARLVNALAVLSPGPGEGRSQLAAELAIAFSQSGMRTLLIDADLRRPKQHLLFGADNDLGLAQVLNRGESVAPYDIEGLPQLSLLTSGSSVANPLEILSDGRFERMLLAWRREYQFVIIDTPPVTSYADGLLIASLCSRVLAVSRANVTSHNSMREMIRRLAATHARILGAVISHF